jgi:hypothetical protein
MTQVTYEIYMKQILKFRLEESKKEMLQLNPLYPLVRRGTTNANAYK